MKAIHALCRDTGKRREDFGGFVLYSTLAGRGRRGNEQGINPSFHLHQETTWAARRCARMAVSSLLSSKAPNIEITSHSLHMKIPYRT